MIKTYTFKIRRPEKHSQWIESALGATRFVYNLAKETREEAYKKGVKLSAFDLQKQLTDAKKESGFEWIKEVPAQTLQGIIERMDDSFKRFFKGAGYPKWASKKKWKSIPFKEVKQVSQNTFQLPKLGKIKVFNPKTIQGKLKTAKIVKEVDGYYLKVQFELELELKIKPKKDLGIDRGLVYFITTSDSEFIKNPKINEKTEKELRILNRKLSRTKKGSNNRIKIIKKLQRLYLKRLRKRLDFLNKLTTKLGNEYETIYLEDLSVSKMVQDKKFSKDISDVAWSKFEELLKYKTHVFKVNPAYTSQECSSCGHVHKDNRKNQSHFKCTSCGHEENADLNASKVILKRGRADLSNAKVDR